MTDAILMFALGWMMGGFTMGLAGFGAGLVAMPLVAPYVDLSVAVPAATLIGLPLGFQVSWRYRAAVPWGGGSNSF